MREYEADRRLIDGIFNLATSVAKIMKQSDQSQTSLLSSRQHAPTSMKPVETSPTSIDFMSLPSEVRIMIYRLIIPQNYSVYLAVNDKRHLWLHDAAQCKHVKVLIQQQMIAAARELEKANAASDGGKPLDGGPAVHDPNKASTRPNNVEIHNDDKFDKKNYSAEQLRKMFHQNSPTPRVNNKMYFCQEHQHHTLPRMEFWEVGQPDPKKQLLLQTAVSLLQVSHTIQIELSPYFTPLVRLLQNGSTKLTNITRIRDSNPPAVRRAPLPEPVRTSRLNRTGTTLTYILDGNDMIIREKMGRPICSVPSGSLRYVTSTTFHAVSSCCKQIMTESARFFVQQMPSLQTIMSDNVEMATLRESLLVNWSKDPKNRSASTIGGSFLTSAARVKRVMKPERDEKGVWKNGRIKQVKIEKSNDQW